MNFRAIRIIVRGMLGEALGRLDEQWYWFYQFALCHLGEDPRKADAMYERYASVGQGVEHCSPPVRPLAPPKGD